jgi:hypothetical protein
MKARFSEAKSNDTLELNCYGADGPNPILLFTVNEAAGRRLSMVCLRAASVRKLRNALNRWLEAK